MKATKSFVFTFLVLGLAAYQACAELQPLGEIAREKDEGPLPRSWQTQRRRRLSRSGWWLRRQLLGRAAARHKSPSSKPPALGEADEEVVVEPAVEAEEDPLADFSSGAVPLAATALGTARALEEEGAWGALGSSP